MKNNISILHSDIARLLFRMQLDRKFCMEKKTSLHKLLDDGSFSDEKRVGTRIRMEVLF